jgi:hypothetical protein
MRFLASLEMTLLIQCVGAGKAASPPFLHRTRHKYRHFEQSEKSQYN